MKCDLSLESILSPLRNVIFYSKIPEIDVKWLNKTYSNEESSGDESNDVCSVCGYAGLGCRDVCTDW